MLLTGFSKLRTALAPVRPVTFLAVHISSSRPVMERRMEDGGPGPATLHRKEHLDLTAGQFRDPDAVEAEVVARDDISPTVKSLTLRVRKSGVTFQSGQWVDFFIPGQEKVGGFSIYSAPSELQSQGTLRLAIKFSTWPPAHWVHTACSLGDTVGLRVGGDFSYPASGLTTAHSLLLVAGGVGINPLYSIWLQARHLVSAQHPNRPQSVTLLYSARTADELIFRGELSSGLGDQFGMVTFLTREGTKQRMQKEDLSQTLEGMQGKKICYICGPASMTEQVAEWLHQLGLDKEDVLYENWW